MSGDGIVGHGESHVGQDDEPKLTYSTVDINPLFLILLC